MIFHAREERALARIEVSLTRSDPGLAAKFERFNSPTSQIMPCEKGQGRPRRKEGKLAALILVSLMMTVCLWAAITGARSQPGSGACAMSYVWTCASSRPGCQATRAASSLGAGGRQCKIQLPPGVP
jgi:hypothetical protein